MSKTKKRSVGRPRTMPSDAVYFRFWLPAELVQWLDDQGPSRQKTIQRIIEAAVERLQRKAPRTNTP